VCIIWPRISILPQSSPEECSPVFVAPAFAAIDRQGRFKWIPEQVSNAPSYPVRAQPQIGLPPMGRQRQSDASRAAGAARKCPQCGLAKCSRAVTLRSMFKRFSCWRSRYGMSIKRGFKRANRANA
jgi:hypothetical protein